MIFSLAAFGMIATFLSSLYPVYPEMLCYSVYGGMFEVLLVAPFILYLMSLVCVSSRATEVSRSHAGLMAGAAAASLFIVVKVVGLVRELRAMQFDAGCERSTGPILLRVFTLAYIGPAISTVLLGVAVLFAYRALKQRAF